MKSSIEKVKEFMELFNQPIGTLDQPEPLEVRQLRIKLLFEELLELATASDCERTFLDLCGGTFYDLVVKRGNAEGITSKEVYLQKTKELHDNYQMFDGDNVDKIEELDALCDIQYVLDGKILTGGFHEIFEENFDIVHRNNMTKAHRSYEHALETADKKGLGEFSIVEKKGEFLSKAGGYLLYNESKKLIKPHDHTKVELKLSSKKREDQDQSSGN